MKADQICYSTLCVFSYKAAVQEQKKNFNPQKIIEQQKQQTQHGKAIQYQFHWVKSLHRSIFQLNNQDKDKMLTFHQKRLRQHKQKLKLS